MRDCPKAEIRDLLPDLARGALGGAQRAAVEAHVASCAECRAELALLRAMRATRAAPAVDVARIVAALPKPSRAGGGASSLEGVVSLEAHRTRRGAPRAWASGGWRRAAAVVLLAAGAGVSYGVLHERGTDVRVDATPLPVAAESSATASLAVTPDTGAARVVAPETPEAPETTRATRAGDQSLGTLGGITSGATDDELRALLAALDDVSGVPEVDVPDGTPTLPGGVER